jgi:D-amino-acid dehydrogenase
MGKEVIVIGGGIVGLSCAYYLAKEGHSVQVFDAGDFRSGASHMNAGYLTPSHIVPLAAPGMVQKGLRYMFHKDSPFYIQPQLRFDLLRWGIKFARSCTKSHVEQSLQFIRDINLFSKDLYLEIKNQKYFDFQLETKGLLMAYSTTKAEKEEAQTVAHARALGLEVQQLDAKQLNALQPEAGLQAAGAFYYLCDAHSTPGQLMQQLYGYLKTEGVRFHPHTPVTSLIFDSGKIKTIATDKGVFKADEFVLCNGVWSAQLAKKIGIPISLEAGKGYAIATEAQTGISIPTLLMEPKVAITPMHGFTRFAGTMELSGINKKIISSRVAAIANGVKGFYPQINFTSKELEAAQCGLRPLSPDGLPYIGKHPKCSNLNFATGHAMMGWSLGPATGKLVAEIISDKTPSLDLSAVSLTRKTG